MPKKKHIFSDCCQTPVMLFKKGKKHRIWVCTGCGKIIMSNPFPIKTLAKIIGKRGLHAVPFLGTALEVAEGAADVYKAVKGTGGQNVSPESGSMMPHRRISSNPLARIDYALR